MPKFIHCADLHLDSPFASLSRSEAERRRREQREAFSSLLSYAKRENFDAVLIAGDLFDGETVTGDTADFLFSEIGKAAPVRVVAAPGNHDGLSGRSPYLAVKRPENFYLFDSECLTRFDFPEINTCFYGFGFEGRCVEADPLEGFEGADPGRINVLVAHGELDSPHPEYCGLYSKEIAACGFDYAALGHIHLRSEPKTAGKTVMAYCGCLVGRGFDETGEKGAYEVTITKEDGVKTSFRRFSDKRFEILPVDVSGKNDPETLRNTLLSEAGTFGENTALRIVFTGQAAQNTDLRVETVRRILNKPFYLEVVDETVPLLDFEKLKSEFSIRGEFYRCLEPMLLSESPEERRVATLALKYGMNALSGREVGSAELLSDPQKQENGKGML